MDRRARVYIVENRKNNDLTSARAFGDLVILYPHSPTEVFMVSKHAYNIKKMLSESQPTDWLIVSGNMILTIIAFGVLLQKHGFVNVLLFDVRTLEYVPRAISKHNLTMGSM